MLLLVGLLVGQLLPSFFTLWYDLPTNSLTNYSTNNRISWIWMRKKMGLNTLKYCIERKKSIFLLSCIPSNTQRVTNKHTFVQNAEYLKLFSQFRT